MRAVDLPCPSSEDISNARCRDARMGIKAGKEQEDESQAVGVSATRTHREIGRSSRIGLSRSSCPHLGARLISLLSLGHARTSVDRRSISLHEAVLRRGRRRCTKFAMAPDKDPNFPPDLDIHPLESATSDADARFDSAAQQDAIKTYGIAGRIWYAGIPPNLRRYTISTLKCCLQKQGGVPRDARVPRSTVAPGVRPAAAYVLDITRRPPTHHHH